jgi:aquaporin Z
MREYWMEFIGAMFLVLVIALSGNPIAIGAVLMVMVYMGGHISGGHYNPAVTLAVWMRGKLESDKVFKYMGSQVAGAFVAAFIYYLLKYKTFMPMTGFNTMWWQASLVEIIFTFALCSVVLAVATTKKLDGNYIYGLAIGFTLMVGAYAGGAISGGVYNPAVAIGPMIFSLLIGGGIGELLLYLIAPFIGAYIAAKTFAYLNPKE